MEEDLMKELWGGFLTALIVEIPLFIWLFFWMKADKTKEANMFSWWKKIFRKKTDGEEVFNIVIKKMLSLDNTNLIGSTHVRFLKIDDENVEATYHICFHKGKTNEKFMIQETINTMANRLIECVNRERE